MDTIKEKRELTGGGGVHIEFTECSPGFSLCSPEDGLHINNSRYLMTECKFKSNEGFTSNDMDSHVIQNELVAGRYVNVGYYGAGIGIVLRGFSFNNYIKITNCNNTALDGGSISAIFLNKAQNNTVSITNSEIYSNHAFKGGGALLLAYFNVHNAFDNMVFNSIVIDDVVFDKNSAGWGGAVAFRSKKLGQTNVLFFTNCSWTRNRASVGAAIAHSLNIWQDEFDGEASLMTFRKCSFHNNVVSLSEAFQYDDAVYLVLESGILDITSSQANFIDKCSFIGSAIYAESAQIEVKSNAVIHFKNNTAINGGAMALHGSSTLELYSGTEIVFEANHASELGGALYATSAHQTVFVFSYRCFVSQHSVDFIREDKWNTSLIRASVDALCRDGADITCV